MMNHEFYITFFPAGASGRFLTNVLCSMVKFYQDNPIILTNYNSAHDMNYWNDGYHLKNLPKITNIDHQNPKFFEYIELTKPVTFVISHQTPNFDLIFSRFPKTLITIISVAEKNFYEISYNSLLKNGFECIDTKESLEVQFIKNFYKIHLKEEYKGQKLPLELKKKLFDSYNDYMSRVLKRSFFLNPIIPKKYENNVLVLSFDDIMNNMDLTLAKLSNFSTYKVTSNAVVLYEHYLEGRNKLINQHMPWLKNT